MFINSIISALSLLQQTSIDSTRMSRREPAPRASRRKAPLGERTDNFGLSATTALWIALTLSMSLFGVAPRAYSQAVGSITENIVVSGHTATGSGGTSYGYGPNSAGTLVGSVSPAATLGGYSYGSLYSAGLRGTFSTVLKVSGFSASPGAAWLNSVTCGSVTFSGSNAVFGYSGTTATYSWHGSALVTSASETCQLNYGGTSGSIFPKYQVVGLTYAPPGSKSTATYANGFLNGTATSNMSSWNNKVTVQVQVTTGASVFGIVNGNATSTASASWTQADNSTSSLSIVQNLSSGLTVPGPPLVSGMDQGVDHDYDIVYVWLNPAVLLSLSGNAVVTSGFYYDDRDGNTPEKCNGTTYSGVTGMDVVPLTVGQLRGTQPIADACLQLRLSRPWDPALGGLTSTDFLEIAAVDPFYGNPSYDPNNDTTSGRYDVPKGQTIFQFVEGSVTPQPYSASYTSTSTLGRSASTAYSVGFSIAVGASANFIGQFGGKVTVSDTYTSTNQWSNTVTSGTSQSNSFTIVPPAAGTYAGATKIQVWKDNIYGTFMFFPEN